MTGFIATETELALTATQSAPGKPFEVALVKAQTDWYDDGEHDFSEVVVGTSLVRAPLPLLFEAVNNWLLEEYHLAALPHSWQISVGETSSTLTLEAHPVPAAAITEGFGDDEEVLPGEPALIQPPSADDRYIGTQDMASAGPEFTTAA